MRVMVDTNCLVAAALSQHEHHAATIADLSRRRRAGQVFVMAAHALVEAFAVLTRLPPPHRLAPADALSVLECTWGRTEALALTGGESWRLLRLQAASGLGGGRVYDGQIAMCARKAKVDELLTWNVRHFGSSPRLRVIAPGSAVS